MRWMILLMISNLAFAEDLGVFGEVYPIAEMSLLKLIQEKVSSIHPQISEAALQQSVNRPKPLNLPYASKHRVFFYRPELVVGQDIQDARGNTLFAKGTKVNALAQLPSYQPCWLFFNADEPLELAWAKKKLCAHPKMILTGGAIKDAETALNTTIYFDQSGVLTQKLGILATPAKVTRAGDVLKIEEVFLQGRAHA